MMTIVNLQLGDVYADGHGIHRDFHINVPDTYSIDDLRVNFKKTVETLGVNPKDFARDYQNSTASLEKIQTLVEAGFLFSKESESAYYYQEALDNDEDYLYLDEEGMIDILMFFYGYGLEGFGWQRIPSPPVLNEETYGYGLFVL